MLLPLSGGGKGVSGWKEQQGPGAVLLPPCSCLLQHHTEFNVSSRAFLDEETVSTKEQAWGPGLGGVGMREGEGGEMGLRGLSGLVLIHQCWPWGSRARSARGHWSTAWMHRGDPSPCTEQSQALGKKGLDPFLGESYRAQE